MATIAFFGTDAHPNERTGEREFLHEIAVDGSRV